ncbi:MAG: hypothetical protein ACRDNO_30035 [Trebonia sp.]
MGKTVLHMSMSVDGFIAGPNEGPGNGLGDGGHRLHDRFLPRAGVGHQGAADKDVLVKGAVTAQLALAAGRRPCCRPGSSTSWNCTSYRSCSARGGGCSATFRPSTSSST